MEIRKGYIKMWEAIVLTIKLATITTFLLLLIGTPLAWWLVRPKKWWKEIFASIIALPLVLPPTVLGFYLLLAFSPNNSFGVFLSKVFGHTLPFTFTGLVIGSVIYSLPFMVQPLRNAFETLGERPLEVAATLRASPLDTFISVVIPMTRSGFLTGAVLSFAHTVGEFGVVLMIGGNIPNETKVLSVAIYDYVESLQWEQAHWLAGGMLFFAFVVILMTSLIEKRYRYD